MRDLRAALARSIPNCRDSAIEEAIEKLTRHDFTRSLLQHNREFYKFIRDGVPVGTGTPGARNATRRPRGSISGTPSQQPLPRGARAEDSRAAHAQLQRRADLVCSSTACR